MTEAKTTLLSLNLVISWDFNPFGSLSLPTVLCGCDDTSFPLDQIPIGFMNLDRNIVVFCHFALLPTNPHLSRNVKISSIV